MEKLKDNEYQCAKCLSIFEKGWSDEECQSEMKDNGFDSLPLDDLCVVCDDCYKELMEKYCK